MVETVGMVGAGSGIDALRAQPVVVSTSSGDATVSLTQKIQPISPSTRSDPMSGVLIMEYFSDEGQVKMQIPSEAAVAYLRSGLSSTGDPVAEKGSTNEPDTSGVIA